jgi:hypothetical protein
MHIGDRSFPASGMIARCAESTTPAGEFAGLPLVHRAYGAVENLPHPAPDTLYIVSALVREAVPWRTDVASPGDMLRDAEGRILGCTNLIVNAADEPRFMTEAEARTLLAALEAPHA